MTSKSKGKSNRRSLRYDKQKDKQLQRKVQRAQAMASHDLVEVGAAEEIAAGSAD
jgi:hypothetical protein